MVAHFSGGEWLQDSQLAFLGSSLQSASAVGRAVGEASAVVSGWRGSGGVEVGILTRFCCFLLPTAGGSSCGPIGDAPLPPPPLHAQNHESECYVSTHSGAGGRHGAPRAARWIPQGPPAAATWRAGQRGDHRPGGEAEGEPSERRHLAALVPPGGARAVAPGCEAPEVGEGAFRQLSVSGKRGGQNAPLISPFTIHHSPFTIHPVGGGRTLSRASLLSSPS